MQSKYTQLKSCVLIVWGLNQFKSKVTNDLMAQVSIEFSEFHELRNKFPNTGSIPESLYSCEDSSRQFHEEIREHPNLVQSIIGK